MINKEAATHEELLCEQAFLLMECVGENHLNPVLGMMKLEELLNDPVISGILETKYQFTPKAFYRENLKQQFYSYEIYRKMQELEYLVQDLKEKNKYQKEHIDLLLDVKDQQQKCIEDIRNSASWKITRPIRKVGDIVKRRR